jgi:serine/threonine protein kinase
MTFDELKILFDSLKIPEWTITGKIGDGATGQANVAEVTRISDCQKGVFRVLKRQNEIDVKRFKREIKILITEKYKHQNILNILAHSEENLWYISEKGDSFKNYWKNILTKYSDTPDKIVEIAIENIQKIIKGLIPLHLEKVVHRDIKPDNIVIVNHQPVLIDFGLVYHPDEERITPVDSAVGNARYSPDQMMNRLEEVPPWLDIFQLSQLLIWMVSEKPTKTWSRPLDWRWVIYPEKMSDTLVLSIKALTAICSDPFVSPSNARELEQLIFNLLSFNSSDKSLDPAVNEIINSIKSGKAKSVIHSSGDLSVFNSSYPIFEKYFLTIEKHIKGLTTIGNGTLPIKFEEKQTIDLWAESIRKTNKFEGHKTHYPYDLYCGERNQGHFYLTTANLFWVPSQLAVKQGTDYLPNDFLPFSMEFGIGSNKDILQQKKPRHMFLAIDKTAQLWRSKFAGDFKTSKQPINIEDVLKEFTSWITDKESWEIINT